jgi:two-component system, sensor histidine kinase and response regulator
MRASRPRPPRVRARILLRRRAPLTPASLEVDVAEDGVRVVQMAGRVRFGLILMDVQMPAMDGLAATRSIRSYAQGKSVLIVAMTANVFSGDRQQCPDAGMDDVPAKPVDPEMLHSTLDRWLFA